jgi:ankyrin repeat protein
MRRYGYGRLYEYDAQLMRELDADHDRRIGKQQLIDAVRIGDVEAVQLLLEEGEDVNAKNESGETALMIAVYHGYTEIVKMLLEHGAEVDPDDIETMKFIVDHNLDYLVK